MVGRHSCGWHSQLWKSGLTGLLLSAEAQSYDANVGIEADRPLLFVSTLLDLLDIIQSHSVGINPPCHAAQMLTMFNCCATTT